MTWLVGRGIAPRGGFGSVVVIMVCQHYIPLLVGCAVNDVDIGPQCCIHRVED